MAVRNLGYLIVCLSIFFGPAAAMATQKPVVSAGRAHDQQHISKFWDAMEKELPPEMEVEIRSVGDALQITLKEKGPIEAHWNRNAIDMFSYLSALDGGVKENAVLFGGELPSLHFFDGLPTNLLDDWTWIRGGSEIPKDRAEIVIFPLSKAHILVITGPQVSTRIGNAGCSQIGDTGLREYLHVYRDNEISADLDDEKILEQEVSALILSRFLSASFGFVSGAYCNMYEVSSSMKVTSSMYSPLGESFTRLNEGNDHGDVVSEFDIRKQITGKFEKAFAGPNETPEDSDGGNK